MESEIFGPRYEAKWSVMFWINKYHIIFRSLAQGIILVMHQSKSFFLLTFWFLWILAHIDVLEKSTLKIGFIDFFFPILRRSICVSYFSRILHCSESTFKRDFKSFRVIQMETSGIKIWCVWILFVYFMFSRNIQRVNVLEEFSRTKISNK